MKLNHLAEDTICTVIEEFYLSDQNDLIIILTDGIAICGSIRSRAWMIGEGLVPASKRCFFRQGYLELYYGGIFNEHSVFIPLQQIAGIHPLSYSQEQIKSRTKRYGRAYYKGSAYEKLFQDLMAKASIYKFPIKRIPHAYSLSMPKPFDWGDITFEKDTPLYSDWNYLRLFSGGLNNLGVGIPLASFSIGWNESLWSLFKKKVKEGFSPLSTVCAKQEAVVSGFVAFFERQVAPNSSEMIEESIEMEGAQWIAAAICDERPKSINDLERIPWALAFFRRDSFMFPKELWEKVSQPLNFFSEVLPANVATNGSQKPCFLKIRTAAFVK